MQRKVRAQYRPAIAIHGGVGVKRALSPRKQEAYRAGLAHALEAGYRILEAGGASLDAVAAAVAALEDSALFNAGRGTVPNAEGRHELDASIMDGETLRAGAVAAVSRIRNPILAARAVMEQSPHVLLVARGAEQFAKLQGLAFVNAAHYRIAARPSVPRKRSRHGTVGAVALDAQGRLAAATSTGGYSGKLPGRVGDSPIIGAGTYADNASCAVSGTGWGEAYIRLALAHDVCARMRYRGESLARAAAAALAGVTRLGGEGGLIALDRQGNIAMPFNDVGMYRACVRGDGRRLIGIYR